MTRGKGKTPEHPPAREITSGAGAGTAADVSAAPPIPADLSGSLLARYWSAPVNAIATLDVTRAAPQLLKSEVLERHQIYCDLLSALVVRFWNGNNRGPAGIYPWRSQQVEQPLGSTGLFRYVGDRNALKPTDPARIKWDRYIGHNIACLAVDGRGEIIDFDFNHNSLFRSSVEHAEARVTRRLFSLTNIFDTWRTGERIPGKSRAFSLNDVTIYTSLESCAQCSGIMSLARVKQVVYLQNDPGQYRIGNVMFNLAGQDAIGPLATLPIPASILGITTMQDLNDAYARFAADIKAGALAKDASRAYFCGKQCPPEFDTSITSFLCTDSAYEIFNHAARRFFSRPTPQQFSSAATGLSNAQCLQHARDFYNYADVEGFRGTPHAG
jgi:tRNA(Arg) A34 adenosine deaminase TadA